MKTPVILLAVLAFSVACSKVEKAEKTMTDMKKQTETMSSTTDSMSSKMEAQYMQLRSGDTAKLRSEQYKTLKGTEEMFGGRFVAASILFKSFEFQLWTGEGKDSDYYKGLLFETAAREFTQHMDDLYKLIDRKKMSPTKDGPKNRHEQSFYAIAATMHMNHDYQEAKEESKKGVKNTTSFYDLVKKSLRKESLKSNPAEYENILVANINREIMVELIKARVDMLSALALKNLTDKRDMTFGQKLKGALFKITGGALGSIDLPEVFAKSNNATKEQTITYLDAAQKARAFLVEIGEDKQLEKTLKSAFKKIDLGDDEEATQTQNETKGDAKKREEIKGLIAQLLS